MEIQFSTYLEEYSYLEKDYQELLDFVFKHLALKADPLLSVSIIDNETINEINKEYRKIDRETDVISFAFLDDEPDREKILKKKGIVDLGEIYISLPKAVEQAKEYSHSLKRELSFLFVHGLLHLLGYDHMEKSDEEKMFALQEEILSLKGITR